MPKIKRPNKKKEKQKKDIKENLVLLEVPVPDFVPYACHYSADTILTKNGELMQVIKVTGFSYETIGGETRSLREVIRTAITNNIKSASLAVWLHTVRRKSNLDPEGEYPENFSLHLNNSWDKKNKWGEQFVNEVYITILSEGQTAKFSSAKAFLKSIFYPLQKKIHDNFLESSSNNLDKVVNGVLEDLKSFGAKKLSFHKEKGVYYSEPLTFLNKVMNLNNIPVKVPVEDLSDYMSSHGVAFGNNAFEVTGPSGKHFGTIFTIKEYHELTDKLLDKLLQLPIRFLITQAIDFVNGDLAYEAYHKQKFILDASKNDYLRKITGIDEIVELESDSETAFGEHQLTIMLIADDLKSLSTSVEDLVYILNKLGIVGVREDLFMEQCFWSQLPGNFRYLCRQSYINTSKVGGYTSLYNFPAGKKDKNHWGPAVTVFRTNNDTPYFFNFHIDDVGHTAIIGPYGAGKTVLLNFLLSESRKFNNKLYFFDQMRASKVFINAIGGKYNVLSHSNPNGYRFNPFRMENNDLNIEFLIRWIKYLMISNDNTNFEPNDTVIVNAINELYIKYKTPDERSIEEFCFILNNMNADKEYLIRLGRWYGEGKYAGFFNSKSDYIEDSGDIVGFGMTHIVNEVETLIPILSYLLYKLELSLDGTPTIIVLDEAWKLMDNDYFGLGVRDWLQALTKKNAMVIFATESVEDVSVSSITKELIEELATQIYLPNADATDVYKEAFNLSDKEFELLHSMDNTKRQFLLKKQDEAIVAKLNLGGMRELTVLSGNDDTVRIMEEIMREKKSSNPEDWLEDFYKVFEPKKKNISVEP